LKIAIIQALWNKEITDMLVKQCEDKLFESGCEILKYKVAGAVELPVMAKNVIIHKKVDAVINIGVIIKGDTDHYDFVAQQVSYGCQKVAIETSVPVIFGILTTPNKELAIARANGSHSSSGIEWAYTAIHMVNSIQSLLKR
jgi:6,7-dimethyl-8-ribityllumazine synthase